METIHLSCRCGRVRLHIASTQIVQFYCHCDDCRAITGGAFSPVALFPTDAVIVSAGETSTWTYREMPRTRCSTCGTLLFGEPPDLGVRGVNGFLLPAHLFAPAFHIRCEHAVMPVNDPLPHYKNLPASFGGSDEVVGW